MGLLHGIATKETSSLSLNCFHGEGFVSRNASRNTRGRVQGEVLLVPLISCSNEAEAIIAFRNNHAVGVCTERVKVNADNRKTASKWPTGMLVSRDYCHAPLGVSSFSFSIERLHVTSQPRLSAILVHNQILPFTDEMVNCAVVRCS